MGAFTVSAVAQVLDLRTVVNVPPYDASQAQAQGGTNSPAGAPRGAVGHFLTIHADGADVGIVVGLSAALVSGGAAPNLAAVGSVDGSGNYTAATGTCYRVPNGQVRRFRLQNTEDHFMGVVAGATGTMRFYVSSPPNP
jgi:hypothetical protein